MTCMLLFGSLLLSTLDEALLIKQTFFFFLFCSTIINACLSQLLFEVLLINKILLFFPVCSILHLPYNSDTKTTPWFEEKWSL